MSNFTDGDFEKFAEDFNAKQALRNGNNSFKSNPREDIKWTACDVNIPAILRFLDAPPDSNKTNFTSRTVNIAYIKGDDGNLFKVVKPIMNADPDPGYILNRIIKKVTQPKWINGKKTFPVKDRYPEIYELIEKNGIPKSDPKYNFNRGWKGKDVLIANVLDRTQMDWHRTNKHSMLLAKSIYVKEDGTEFVDEGVSSFGVLSRLSGLFGAYGNWENYDIAITRTGRLENPYNIVNASNSPKEVDKNYQQYISTEHLTDEESGWTRYDISKLFGWTSATKIFNKLGNTIKRIDGALGTEYYDELKSMMEKEKAEWTKEQEQTPSYTSPTSKIEENLDSSDVPWNDSVAEFNEVDETPEPVKPAVTRTRATVTAAVSTPTGPRPGEDVLPYYNTLPEDLKKKIISAKKNKDGTVDIVWDVPNPEEDLANCPNCMTPSPMEATTCCNCGLDFA